VQVAIKTYNDASEIKKSFQKCGITDVTDDTIKSTRESITDELIHPLLQRLVTPAIEKRQGWMVSTKVNYGTLLT
jgi:hypothetical protein